jgi:hypothetical protein
VPFWPEKASRHFRSFWKGICEAGRRLPEDGSVRDFGVRGFDLAHTLLDPYGCRDTCRCPVTRQISRDPLYDRAGYGEPWKCSEKQKRGDTMTKVALGVLGLFAIVVAISIAPDIRRYVKMSSM